MTCIEFTYYGHVARVVIFVSSVLLYPVWERPSRRKLREETGELERDGNQKQDEGH